MVRSSELKHHHFKNTAFGYNSNDTPLNGPHWESGSKNILTSIKQYSERPPGFAAYEGTPTVFTGSIKRIFTWEKWDGTFFILLCATWSGHSVVYKLKVGTDAAFVALYDDVTSPTNEPFDFCVSNNTLFFCNGSQAWKYDGTAVSPWGIGTSPMVGLSTPVDYSRGRPVTSVDGSGSFAATVGYQYVYCYYNSQTFHVSSASNPSIATGAFTGKAHVTVTGIGSPDQQVDKIRIFRTTDGGGGIYFELPNSPIANPQYGLSPIAITTITTGATTSFYVAAGHGLTTLDVVSIFGILNDALHPPINGSYVATVSDATHFSIAVNSTGGTYLNYGYFLKEATWTIDDTATDLQLSSTRAPMGVDNGNDGTVYYLPSGINDSANKIGGAPLGPVWFANRIWSFKDNKVWYSGWEEIDIGVEEECIPPDNFMVMPKAVTGLASNDEMLLVFTANGIWKITGDSLLNFRRDPLFADLGCRNRTCIARYGKAIAWFDKSHTIRITDGFTQKELSIDIRPDLASISPTTACLSFFSDGVHHWLVFLDGNGGKAYVYDLDQEQWMPPWDYVGKSTAMYWGETAAGTPLFLVGSAAKKMLKMTPAAYTFDGATYAAEARSHLHELVPPTQPARIANAQIITLERNAVALTDLAELRDEDPDSGTYTSDFANIATVGSISPPLRPVATNLVEEWFTTQQTACKRMSVKFSWAAASTNFKLYAYSIGFYELT